MSIPTPTADEAAILRERGGKRRRVVSASAAVEVAHGYTLDDLDRCARAAVNRTGPMATDYAHRLDAAWGGVVEHLCASAEPPSPYDLIGAGRRAIQLHIRGELRAHGISRSDVWAGYGSMPDFARFWFNPGSPGPEERVVDRVAVRQILPSLSDRQRQALGLLAAREDYQLAADAMGVSRATFNSHISHARRRFFALWHEGETPRRRRMDKRVHKHGAAPGGGS